MFYQKENRVSYFKGFPRGEIETIRDCFFLNFREGRFNECSLTVCFTGRKMEIFINEKRQRQKNARVPYKPIALTWACSESDGKVSSSKNLPLF